ncbi:hypothetical protein [Bradyrhizobium zhanjiangense]|uniref:Uncharacterized protein n=1 Tax=Bradyrhizobium zhanjiangense TaxID=1325107 RepID=A0A4Q0RVD4_9BRAD|nr:hypothetical protein [Bradyrhizobium zhanjiangense]RXH21811.1 hypothetical protein XH94_37905 [Bradyrhizobium zhanjiangense]
MLNSECREYDPNARDGAHANADVAVDHRKCAKTEGQDCAALDQTAVRRHSAEDRAGPASVHSPAQPSVNGTLCHTTATPFSTFVLRIDHGTEFGGYAVMTDVLIWLPSLHSERFRDLNVGNPTHELLDRTAAVGLC